MRQHINYYIFYFLLRSFELYSVTYFQMRNSHNVCDLFVMEWRSKTHVINGFKWLDYRRKSPYKTNGIASFFASDAIYVFDELIWFSLSFTNIEINIFSFYFCASIIRTLQTVCMQMKLTIIKNTKDKNWLTKEYATKRKTHSKKWHYCLLQIWCLIWKLI